jgi:hypothetical protein
MTAQAAALVCPAKVERGGDGIPAGGECASNRKPYAIIDFQIACHEAWPGTHADWAEGSKRGIA